VDGIRSGYDGVTGVDSLVPDDFTPDLALPFVRTLTGLWLPALACFSGFWFSLKASTSAKA
jgi:hypothetical protein